MEESSTRKQKTLASRTEAKLLEKTSWFKGDKKRKQENMESKYQYQPQQPQAKRRRKGKMANGKGGSKEIKSVMFIPYTAHSELATRMRENEEMMKEMTGYRIKIVEKTGVKLVDMLHRANPWAGEECGRNRCLLCETKKREGKKNSQDCHKRNCVYQTYCRTCT